MRISLNVSRPIALLRIGYLSLVALLTVLIWSSPVRAKEEKEEDQQSFTVGAWAFSRLSKAHELIGQNKYAEALKVLEEIKNRRRINDHERAMMWQTYGFVWSSKGNFNKSIEAFEECLALNAMPKGAMTEIEFNLGQLYLAQKNYKKGIAILESWLAKVENPSPNAQYLIGQAYAQDKRYKKALEYAKLAVSRAKKPQESWYQFLLSLHYQLGQYADVAKILELLVAKYPKRTYWLQLAAMYSQLKREKQALAVFELAYLQGHLEKEAEYMNLASLYMQQGVPYKAAKVLQHGMGKGIVGDNAKALRMVAESYLYARENDEALKPLQEAAKQFDKGDLYIQLAQIHMDEEEFDKASRALNQAFKKGKLTNPGVAYLLLGMTKVNLDQYPAALNAFNKASQHKRTKNAAEKWIKIVKTKIKEKKS
ncbi:MAG: tetratricopeptide repeat protein [Myxococcota bacterium]|nr:tetratricopeptide repeat protein [Myxococcota bacterium]